MKFLTETFNNREIAIILWSSAFFIWSITKGNIRECYKQILKVFFKRKIIIPTLFMLLYVFGITLAFFTVSVWDFSNLKDTIFWTLAVGFVTFFNLNKASADEDFFKKMILDNVKLIIILEYIFNLYVFNFWVEFIVLPLVALVVIAKVLTEKDPSYNQVDKLFNVLLGIYVLSIIIFSIHNIVTDFSGFGTFENLKSFLLPPVYLILYLPFAYTMALYIIYETVFVRLSIFNNEKELVRYARRKILFKYHLNLKRLTRWFRRVGTMKVNSKAEVLELISDTKKV